VVFLAPLGTEYSLAFKGEAVSVNSNCQGRFRHNGSTIAELDGQIPKREYRNFVVALEKFSDSASCLSSGGSSFTHELKTLEDLEVCIFKSAQGYPNPSAFSDWAESIGFRTDLIGFPSDHYRHGETKVIGYWEKSRHGSVLPIKPNLWTWIRTFGAHSGVRFDAVFSEENCVKGVELSFSRGP
jgi:hypothetical protein